MIGKREYENDVVWIILQAHQFKWKKLIITEMKGDGTDLMSIIYANPNHREKFFKLDTVQDEVKTTTYVPIVVMLPSILGLTFCDQEKTSWELHRIVKERVEQKEREVKQIVRTIL